jgi:hypothetical protein
MANEPVRTQGSVVGPRPAAAQSAPPIPVAARAAPLAEPANGSSAASPLAQAIRGGANVGAVERPQVSETSGTSPQAPVEGEEQSPNPIHASQPELVKGMLKTLLLSTDIRARLKALKMVRKLATPDMAANIAMAVDASIESQRETVMSDITKEVRQILHELLARDTKTTIESLATIFLERITIASPAGGTIDSAEHDAVISESCFTIKKPELLLLADKAIAQNNYGEALAVIKFLGMPEGIERLQRLMPTAMRGIAANEFLDACEAIGTPECLPLLEQIKKNSNRFDSRIADIMAKILGISMS